MKKFKILSSGIIVENMFYCILEHNNGEYYELYCLDNVLFPPNFQNESDIEHFLMKHDIEGYSVSGTLDEIIKEYKELLL